MARKCNLSGTAGNVFSRLKEFSLGRFFLSCRISGDEAKSNGKPSFVRRDGVNSRQPRRRG